MECEQVKDKLVEFVDDEMPDDIRRTIQSHLDNCASCSAELESLRAVLDLCRRWKDIEPSKDWEKGLKRRLSKSQRQPETELEILRSAIIGLNRRVQKLEELLSTLPPTLEGEIMTINELARYLRLNVSQVYKIIDQIPKFRVGYEYRFVRESIDRWIRSLERHPYSPDYSWPFASTDENDT